MSKSLQFDEIATDNIYLYNKCDVLSNDEINKMVHGSGERNESETILPGVNGGKHPQPVEVIIREGDEILRSRREGITLSSLPIIPGSI